ncbi:dihydrodipicolinate synthase family protein [Silvibacterium acidisoli]|uniref:dihydrodipicolinate synthase family protein n=1 Tax=Acidobacteriaceae bacterium ZG23-2 TaxID=2883246 RepID=UPI00406CF4E7
MQLARPLRGIIPPLVTPLSGPDTLDVAGLERLIDHQIRGGVHGIFVLGTTGEGPALAYETRRELIRRVVKHVDGRVAVLVGVTDTAYSETRKLARYAAEEGADAVVVAPPYYFYSSQQDLLEMVRQLAKDSDLPIFLYNMPSMTKMWFEPETVLEAAKIDKVYGLKDSSGDLDYLARVVELMHDRTDFTILIGPEELLRDGMKLGAHGGVNGGANVLPQLYVDLYSACAKGEDELSEKLHRQVLDFGNAVYDPADKEYRHIRGLKSGLSVMGICNDLPVWPYRPCGGVFRTSVAEYLERQFQLQV